MQEREDTYLINQILGGDECAFSELVDRYQTKIYNFVRYTIQNDEDAYEVTQDTFVKAYRSLNTFRNEAKFSTWLMRIAYFTCMTRLRKKKPVMLDLVDYHGHLQSNNIHRETELSDMKTVLAIAFISLSEQEQVIVTLFYYNELSIKEICEINGETVSNVKVSLHRSRKKLLKAMHKLGIKEWVL